MAGPKSRLTPEEWEQIAARVANGESMRSVALAFKIDEKLIRRMMQAVRGLAQRIAETNVEQATQAAELSAMPDTHRAAVRGLASTLQDISSHLAHAARFGAISSHRLAMLANGRLELVDDTDPTTKESYNALMAFSALTKLANSSSEIGLNLLRANKETVDEMNRAANDPPAPTQIVFSIADADA